MKLISLFFIYFISLSSPLWANSLVEDANLNSDLESENVFKETIKIISQSKRIFILSNINQQLGTGDFISLAMDDSLAARAVVAKVHQGQVGIKILKIYSLTQWGRLRRNAEVQIIKGDDSFFEKNKKANVVQADEPSKIRSEDDLYTGDVVIEDEVGVFNENKNRHIKPDNIIAFNGAFFDAPEIASKGGTVRTNELGISWGFQFSDNYFVEGVYGRAMLDNYPGDGAQTLVNHLTARLKYTIKGPLFTFFMPYIGYHSYTVSSPDAGKTNNVSTNAEELEVINSLKKTGPVFGVTVLRRLVPGWFLKADLGSDIVNVGFAIEF